MTKPLAKVMMCYPVELLGPLSCMRISVVQPKERIVKNSPKHSRRRWAPHAIGAGSLALLAFLGGAAPEFLSDDFKRKFAPYNKCILAIIIVK